MKKHEDKITDPILIQKELSSLVVACLDNGEALHTHPHILALSRLLDEIFLAHMKKETSVSSPASETTQNANNRKG